MIRYRIKTEQEFIDEFGYSWRRDCEKRKSPVSFVESMDKYFGMEIDVNGYDTYELTECYNLKCIFRKGEVSKFDLNNHLYLIKHETWSISMDMIKQVGINYNHKKTLVYD